MQPGEGFVQTAEGRVRRITEKGKFGPIDGAQKVPGFTRTLVSVLDLAEKFDRVYFDKGGVYVRTGETVTNIGSVTPSRLYSFDMSALQRHAALVG